MVDFHYCVAFCSMCYSLDHKYPKDLCVEALVPSLALLGGGTYGRSLGHWACLQKGLWDPSLFLFHITP